MAQAVVNLPGTFLGRRRELDSLTEVERRGATVVSLLGPGGIGKTALALSWLGQRGVPTLHVLAEAIRTREELLSAIAEALDAPFVQTPSVGEIAHTLSARGLAWLFVDECEHLEPDARTALSTLARLSAPVRLLVTSRVALAVPHEVIVEVGPLSLDPDAADESDCERLFVARIRGFRPDYELSAAEKVTLRRVVHALEGYPLAIELAAPWLKVMSLAELEHRLTNRSVPLKRTGRADDKHGAMEDVIASSWAQLTEEERRALVALSVLESPFDLAAAEAVLASFGGRAELLVALREKSLLRQLEPHRGELGLFAVVREFVLANAPAERLLDARRAHIAYFHDAAEQLLAMFERDDQDAFHRTAAISHNVTQAAWYALAAEGAAGATMAIDLAWMIAWQQRFFTTAKLHEVLRAIDARLPQLGLDERARARLLVLRATMLIGSVHSVDGLKAAVSVLASESPARHAFTLYQVAREVSRQGAFGFARELLLQASTLGASAGTGMAGWIEARLAFLPDESGERSAERFPAAKAALERALVSRPNDPLTLECFHSVVLFAVDVSHEEAAELAARLMTIAKKFDVRSYDRLARFVMLFAAVDTGDLATFDRDALALVDALERDARQIMMSDVCAVMVLVEAGRERFDRMRTAAARADRVVLGPRAALVDAMIWRADALERRIAHDWPNAPPADLAHDERLAFELERAVCDVVLSPDGAADHGQALAELRNAFEAARAHAPCSFWLRVQLRSMNDLLAKHLPSSVEREPRWVVDQQARAVRGPNGELVDFSAHPVLWTVLEVLVEEHLSGHTGRALSSKALSRRAWRDQRLVERSALDRTRTSVARLRRMGLGAIIQSTPAGYLIDASVRIVRV